MGELFLERLTSCHPDERLRMLIPCGHEFRDRCFRIFLIMKRSSAEILFSQLWEPILDEDEPIGTCQNQKRIKPQISSQPSTQLGILVSAAIASPQAQGHPAGELLAEATQEFQQLLLRFPGNAWRYHRQIPFHHFRGGLQERIRRHPLLLRNVTEHCFKFLMCSTMLTHSPRDLKQLQRYKRSEFLSRPIGRVY